MIAHRVDARFADDGSAGGMPQTLEFGDVDGDGDLDVVSPYVDILGEVSVLLNNGDGQFAKATHYSVGSDPSHAILLDLDADGDLDIAVSIDDEDTVETLFNDGTGFFEGGGTYAVGDRPRSMVSGDFDADGDADLAVLNDRDDFVSILLNNGDGTFADQVRVDTGRTTPRVPPLSPGPFLAIADLDGDGDLDIAVPSFFHVRILLNDGDGNFALSDHSPRSSEMAIYAISAGDLDGDGDQDLAASIATTRSLMAVWLNDGTGTFPDATIYDSSYVGEGANYLNPSISLGDMDNDGDLDAAMGHHFFGRHVIHRNNGDGTFAPYEAPLVQRQPWFVKWADLNGDGWLDLGVLAGLSQFPLFMARLNDGSGNLWEVQNVEENFPNTEYSAADVQDVDGDGSLDLALGLSTNDPFDYRVLQGDGTGAFIERFQGRFPIPTPVFVSDMRLAHMDNDQHPDLVFAIDDDQTTSDGGGSVWIALGADNFQFGEPTRFETPDGEPFGMDLADIDGDGDLDVLARVRQVIDPDDIERPLRNWVMVFRNDGTGNLVLDQSVFLHADRSSRVTGDVIAGDFDGDGDLDALASSGLIREAAPLYYLENDGTGSYSVANETIVASWAHSLAVGDWDHDGDLDVAAMHWRDEIDREYLTILDNDGSANFTPTQTYTDTDINMGNKMLAADVNSDGWDDLLLVTNKTGVVIHLNDRRGGFADSAWYASNTPTAQVFVADFDHDGDNDVLAPSRNDGGLGPIVLLENVACRCPADLDRDGVLTPNDFFLFLDRYTQGNLAFCDVDHDGDCDAEDFFAYLDLFAAGC